MSEMTATQETTKQGWVKRLITAVFEKLFDSICQHEIGISPYDSHNFMHYSGYGWDEAMMYQAMARTKLYEEEI